MSDFDFFAEIPVSVTICDTDGIVVYMNDRAAETFAKDGGADLVGRSLLDCHTGESKARFLRLLEEGKPNSYTIEKNGVRKMIHQTPWFIAGIYSGFIEFSFELPAVVPHFIRK